MTTKSWIKPVADKFIVGFESTEHPGKVWFDHGARYHSMKTATRRATLYGRILVEGECPLPPVTQQDLNQAYWDELTVEQRNNWARATGRHDLFTPTVVAGTSVH